MAEIRETGNLSQLEYTQTDFSLTKIRMTNFRADTVTAKVAINKPHLSLSVTLGCILTCTVHTVYTYM